MMSDRHSLLALIGGIRCTRTLLPTEYTLVHITSPLAYQHTVVLRVEGINVNHVVAIILAYYTHAESKALTRGDNPDEDEFTAGCIAALMEGCRHLDKDSRIWLSTAAHVTYAGQSGVTVHVPYIDDDKLLPQTQLSLYEKGKKITTQYVNDLTLMLPQLPLKD